MTDLSKIESLARKAAEAKTRPEGIQAALDLGHEYTTIISLIRRIGELEKENADLKHDIERSQGHANEYLNELEALRAAAAGKESEG